MKLTPFLVTFTDFGELSETSMIGSVSSVTWGAGTLNSGQSLS
jgi:hypothetical protein